MSELQKPYYNDEAAAFAELERLLWPDGPVCPHCGGMERAYRLKGKSTRIGLWKCGHCRKQFTVKVGTVYESSHVPLHKWFQAVYLLSASKKGCSSHQLHRSLGVTYKTAWFMAHRIREAMAVAHTGPLGGAGETIELDETFIGNMPNVKKGRRGHWHKYAILGLVQRDGAVRSFHVGSLKSKDLAPLLEANVSRKANVMTDNSGRYRNFKSYFASHQTVNHYLHEYARGDVTTNRIEGYFSIFKRGMKGVYQHCSGKHLHRYLAEFDFRYNHRSALGVEDTERMTKAVMGAVGKRLTYRRPDAQEVKHGV